MSACSGGILLKYWQGRHWGKKSESGSESEKLFRNILNYLSSDDHSTDDDDDDDKVNIWLMWETWHSKETSNVTCIFRRVNKLPSPAIEDIKLWKDKIANSKEVSRLILKGEV